MRAPAFGGCPHDVPLTEEHIGCRCGIEVLTNLHFRDANRLRKKFPDQRWQCNEENRLAIVNKSVFEAGATDSKGSDPRLQSD